MASLVVGEKLQFACNTVQDFTLFGTFEDIFQDLGTVLEPGHAGMLPSIML